jgi:hypothetical protein
MSVPARRRCTSLEQAAELKVRASPEAANSILSFEYLLFQGIFFAPSSKTSLVFSLVGHKSRTSCDGDLTADSPMNHCANLCDAWLSVDC